MKIDNINYSIFKNIDFEHIKEEIEQLADQCFEIYKNYIVNEHINNSYNQLLYDYSDDGETVNISEVINDIKIEIDNIKLSYYYKSLAVSAIFDHVNDYNCLESPYDWLLRYDKSGNEASLELAEELDWYDLYSQHIIETMSDILGIAPF